MILKKHTKTSVKNKKIKNKKKLSKLGIKGIFLNLIKNIYKKPTANIIHNGEAFEDFPLNSRTRQECSFSHILSTLYWKT